MTAATTLTAGQLETLRTLIRRQPDLRVLTVKQPWADLIMAGVKDVENRSWPVPSTLPQWYRCQQCRKRVHQRELPEWWTPETRHNCRPGMDVVQAALMSGGPTQPDGPFPFRLGIHAAAKVDRSDAAREAMSAVDWQAAELEGPVPLGALLGTVEVTGCHHADECGTERRTSHMSAEALAAGAREESRPHCSRWAQPDAYHWTLTDPQPLDVPIPMRGMLGLWRLPAEVAA